MRDALPDMGNDGIVLDNVRRGEVHREIVRALAYYEEHSMAASLTGLALCCAAMTLMPFSWFLPFTIAARALSIATTRMACNRLRYDLEHGRDYSRSLKWAGTFLALAGISWALLLWPVLPLTELEAGPLILTAAVITGCSLIASMLGALPWVLSGFSLCFVASLAVGIYTQMAQVPFWFVPAICVIICAALLFSFGSARQVVAASEMIVTNRELNDRLGKALAESEYLASHDPLTGLLNRRALFANGFPDGNHAVIVIDLDHFKQINDIHGHETGDRVLNAVGGVLSVVADEIPGQNNLAVRMGGEEFALVFKHADMAALQGYGALLRQRIAALTEPFALDGMQITASIGLALRGDGETLEAALNRADDAMYCAKRNGRDRVEVWQTNLADRPDPKTAIGR